MPKSASPIHIPQIPQQIIGGTIRGIGENFRPELSHGSSQFSFPLEITQSRDLTPELSLRYSSGLGNDIFGVGFELAHHLSIQRSTKFGAPNYDDNDTFVSSAHGELVAVLDENQGPEKKPRETAKSTAGKSFKVRYYRPRVDKQFAEIEYWRPESNDKKTADTSFWVIREANGVVHILGDVPKGTGGDEVSAVIQHPAKLSTYQWLIRESLDAKGNKIRYDYNQDAHTEENPQSQQRYVQAIHYGNYQDSSKKEHFAFTLSFDYGKT